MENFNQEENLNQKTFSNTNNQEPQAPKSNGNIDWGGDIQKFFSNDLKEMLTALFKKPASGAQKWLTGTKSQSVVNPLCMIVLSFVAITILTLLVLRIKFGDMWEYTNFDFGTFVKIGLFPAFLALFVTIISFIFMSIKGKPDILLAFRHSSVHVLLLTIAFVAILLTTLIFIEGRDIMRFGRGMSFGFILVCLESTYAMLMGISASHQLLKSCDEDGKECYSWYLAPIVVILSFYLTTTIIRAMF